MTLEPTTITLRNRLTLSYVCGVRGPFSASPTGGGARQQSLNGYREDALSVGQGAAIT